jgi:threonylcarbamoyladenosine tRNA methylthiotransferase MtaB
MFGFTSNYVKVAAKYDPIRVNDVVKVQLTGISEDGLAIVEEVSAEMLAHH